MRLSYDNTEEIIMQEWDYYTTTTHFYPNRKDFTTWYVYHKGDCIFQGGADAYDNFKKTVGDTKYAVERLVNEDDFIAARRAYTDEKQALMEEFQRDLFREFDVQSNPKRFKCYDLAWDRGHSAGLYEVYGTFQDLVELIQ